jgi:CxC6 like cysteine cluster associated with KDZ transposases
MTAGIHDGVSVCHVQCSEKNCTEPVPTQRSLFCHSHRENIKKCCVYGCDSLAETGFRTCTLQAHRDFQTETNERNSAMFQLHARLRNAGVSQVPMAGTIVCLVS